MSITGKMPAFWRRRSLRFWLATGMLMSLVPIFASAVTGYVLYHQVVIQPLVEVASKQRSILQPLREAQLSLWNVSESTISFTIAGMAQGKIAYQKDTHQIDADFAQLAAAMQEQGLAMSDVKEAQREWQKLTTLSNTILSGGPLHGDAAVGKEVKEFETLVNRLNRQLETVEDIVLVKNERTYEQALASLALVKRLAVGGLAVSIMGAILGIVLINRSLVSSMDQLATGAMRVAAGDREHRIEVHIPRELINVADAFNLMTTRIREQEDALERVAGTDGLTGLYNRREFDRMFDEEIRRAVRYGKPVSLIIGDIDHFKRFNDTYGHQAGDEALCAVAQTLEQNLRDVDKTCRFGGEEFVVILPECDAQAARQSAERLRAAVKTALLHPDGERTATVTMSLGVATFPGNGDTPDTLLKSADLALYRSKEQGRNRVVFAA